jgi:hypothetical protein
LNTWGAARPNLRTVADASVLHALRGDASSGASEWLDARRALTGAAGDASVLERMGARLGCSVVVEVGAIPTGLHLRTYDVVTHRFATEFDVRTWTPAVLDEALGATVRVTNAPAQGGPFGIASTATLVLTQPTPAARSSSSPAAADPRVSVQPNRPMLGGYGGWIIAGGAALAVIGAALILGSQGPASPVINVHHAERP